MIIEKLQKVATTHVDASFKASWLRWWNSPSDVKTKNKYPSFLPLREKILEDWFHKASFWAQVLQYLIENSRIRCMCMYVDYLESYVEGLCVSTRIRPSWNREGLGCGNVDQI